MKKLILASKSPYRKELLEKLNIKFTCMDSEFDESELKKLYSNPVELTQKLAIAKAMNIHHAQQDAVIIGSDQLCHLNGKIMGKSGSLDKSFEQLKHLSGKTHQLVTSFCILVEGKIVSLKTNTTHLTLKDLTEKQIKKYLSIDNPVDCAGSYKLELNGIGLMKEIDTSDYTAIVGLPLLELSNELENLGFSVFSA